MTRERPTPRRRPARPLALVAFATIAAACGGEVGEPTARATLSSYFAAVQSGELERIAPHLAGCGDDCTAEIGRRLDAVEAQREAGEYAFDHPWGFGLVRALVLGRGGYWTVQSVEPQGESGADGGAALVRLRVLTQYDPDETVGLPRNAVIEYLGRPLGHVEKIPRGGGGPGTLRWQLTAIELEASLERTGDGWAIRSLEPLPETAEFEQVTWRPK